MTAPKKGKSRKKPKSDVVGTFLIGGCNWTLRYPTKISIKELSEKGKTTLGYADPVKKQICVLATLGEQDRNSVLLHELVHAIAMEYGHLEAMAVLNSCEHSIDSMAKEISSFMRQTGIIG